MEFFREVHRPGVGVGTLWNRLTIDDLPKLCASISSATPRCANEGEIYCVWGAFNVRRDQIRNGVRYALLDCPHALTWTVTYDEARHALIVHCTIDKTDPDPEFAESIDAFVEDWSAGLSEALPQPGDSHAPVRSDCIQPRP